MKLWLNGALLDAAAARIDPADRGFTLGDGVFETIRVGAGVPAFLPLHLERLLAGAALLQIPLDWDGGALALAIEQILNANGLRDAAIRVTLTRGPAPRGVLPGGVSTPTLLITTGPLPPDQAPARAIVCTVTRRNEASPLARIKSLNYLDGILARQEAAAHGVDEAILLNTKGTVAEASGSNVFMIRDGVIITPPVEDGALPGIMRAALIANCGVVEKSLGPEDLRQAEAMFLSNALGLRIVSKVDEMTLPTQHDLLGLVLSKQLLF